MKVMSKKIIYFLCTGNSCRSQMAEGWAEEILGEEWEVHSAGIEAHGVNPNAIKAMNEVGIDISNQTSDIIDLDILNQATLAVTLRSEEHTSELQSRGHPVCRILLGEKHSK